MKILAISQAYWPDTVSISQHLTDLSVELSRNCHDVSILTSRNDYENPTIKYKKEEIYENVHITRLGNTSFGKKKKIFRLLDFCSFNLLITFKILQIKKSECRLIISLTQPPLLAFIGLWIARLKKIKFLYWTMDLQPELSIVANYLSKNSISANTLQKMGDFIFRNSDTIITLDKYMKQHILNRTNTKADIKIIPVWPVMDSVYSGVRNKNPFRINNNFGDKIVVMYSGNHSVMHPLDTLLETARLLKDNPEFIFVHIGGGVRINDVRNFKERYDLQNICLLPYQPRESIHLSLGAADLQVVILGNDCIGYTHPNKIYGAMYIGKPILYIGPEKSHISDILKECEGNISVKHDDVDSLVAYLLDFAKKNEADWMRIGQNNLQYAQAHFSKDFLLSQMLDAIESTVS